MLSRGLRSILFAVVVFALAGILAWGVNRYQPWYIPEWRQHAVFDAGEPVTAVAVTADGSLVALGHSDGRITFWWPDTQRPPMQWQAGSSRIAALAFTTDEALLLSGTVNNAVTAWDVATTQQHYTVNTPFASGASNLIRSLSSFSRCPTSPLIVIGNWQGKIVVFDVTNGRVQQSWQGPPDVPVMAVACNTNTVIAFGERAGKVLLRDLTQQRNDEELATDANRPRAITFVENDTELLVAYDDGNVRRWSLTTNQVIGKTFSVYEFFTAQFDPSGTWLAYSGSSGLSAAVPIFSRPTNPRVYVTHVNTGERCATFHGHRDVVTSVAWRADSSMLVSGSLDGTVRVWDVRDCQ